MSDRPALSEHLSLVTVIAGGEAAGATQAVTNFAQP
jgi:hypothetical protein